MLEILTKPDDTSVVDLSFNGSRLVETTRKIKQLRRIHHQHKVADHSRLATNFEDDTAMSGFGIVNGFGGSFNIIADTMIITGRESFQIVQSM